MTTLLGTFAKVFARGASFPSFQAGLATLAGGRLKAAGGHPRARACLRMRLILRKVELSDTGNQANDI